MASQLDNRRLVAEAAARAAGEVHLHYRLGAIHYRTKNGDLRDLVSIADIEGQEAARAVIQSAFPGEPIVGEEDAASEAQLEALLRSSGWVIDPLDGTFMYLYGFPDFSATVAFVDQRRPVAGAVYAPVLEESFSAAAGLGASLNGKPIGVSSRRGLSTAIVNVWLGEPEDDGKIARLAEVRRLAFSQRSFGGSALVLAYVACGRYDLYFTGDNPRMGPWDVAAGALLVQEAGGVVSLTDGSPFTLPTANVAAAANRQTLDELRALVSG